MKIYPGTLILLSILMIMLFLGINACSAWNSGNDKTHEQMAASLYQEMPHNIKSDLDLEYLKKGADKPDVLDKNKKYRHAYPASLTYIEKYIKQSHEQYHKAISTADPVKKKYYFKRESYFLGMASHYISDTYAAPHTTLVKNHALYYKFADLKTNLKLLSLPAFSLKSHAGMKSFLIYGKKEGSKAAFSWNKLNLRTQKAKAEMIVESNLDLSYSAVVAVFKSWLGY